MRLAVRCIRFFELYYLLCLSSAASLRDAAHSHLLVLLAVFFGGGDSLALLTLSICCGEKADLLRLLLPLLKQHCTCRSILVSTTAWHLTVGLTCLGKHKLIAKLPHTCAELTKASNSS